MVTRVHTPTHFTIIHSTHTTSPVPSTRTLGMELGPRASEGSQGPALQNPKQGPPGVLVAGDWIPGSHTALGTQVTGDAQVWEEQDRHHGSASFLHEAGGA
jgi:hypothetical protein